MGVMPRWVMWLLAGVVIAVAIGFVVLLATPHSDDTQATPADAKVLQAYVDALRPPTSEGGQIVEQEMKPSLSEYTQGKVDGPTFTARARGWVLAMQRVKADIDRIQVPAVIASAGPLFDQAMDAYIHTARLFEDAGGVTGTAKDAAVQRAVDAARAADQAYDRAAVVVQRALRQAGLPPDSALPDPTPSPS